MTAQWTEMWSAFTPAGTGWQDYDIFTALGVPKGAIAHIVMLHNDYSNPRTMGVRADGSALNRYIKVHKSVNDDAGVVGCAMYVKVHTTTGLIETYVDTNSSVTFYCSGYWTGVDFTEMMSSVTTSGTAAWVDWDVGALGVPYESICSVACCNHQDAGQSELGVRTNGSVLARFHTVHQALSSATETTDCESFTISVVSDASDGIIEYYNNGGSVSKYHLLGYFGTGLWYTETVWNLATGSGTDQIWTDVNVSAYVPAGAVMDCMIANTRSFAYNVGARANGSSLQRKWVAHQPEDTYRSGECLPTAVDASGIYEMIDYDWGYPRNGPYGYYTTTAPPQVAVFSPSANSFSGTSWSNPTYAYSDNTQYATSSTNNANNTYYNYGITGLSGTIQKVEVDALSFVANSSSANKLRIAVSWDGGTTWSSNTDLSVTNTSTPTDKWLDVTSATSWDWDKLSDANLRVKVTYVLSGTARVISLDWIPVRVTYVEQSVTELTISDEVDLGDVVVVTKTIVVLDSIGAQESTALAKGMRVADAIGSDDEIAGMGKALKTADALSLADIARLFKTLKATESIIAGDIVKLVKSMIATDVLHASDAALLSKAIRLADALHLTDVATAALVGQLVSITVTDGIGLSDSSKLVKALKAVDALGAADMAMITKALKVTDTAMLADASKLVKSMRLAEVMALGDAAKIVKGIKAGESISASDAQKIVKALKVAQTIAAADSPKLSKALKVADAIALAEAVKTIKQLLASDVVSATDAGAIAARRLLLIIADALGLADNAVLSKAIKAPDALTTVDVSKLTKALRYADQVSVAELVAMAKALKVAQTISASDAPKISKGLRTSETVTATDAPRLGKQLLSTETINAAEAALLSKALRIGDAASFVEASKLGKSVKSADSIASSDSGRLSKTLRAIDAITVADTAKLYKALVAAESIALAEALRWTKSLVVADGIELSDHVLAGLTGHLISIVIADAIGASDSSKLGKQLKISEAVHPGDATRPR